METSTTNDAEMIESLTYYGKDFEDGLEIDHPNLLPIYRSWPDGRKRAFAFETNTWAESRMMAELAKRLATTSEAVAREDNFEGPSYRHVNVVGRLVYIGALPIEALVDEPFADMLLDWLPRVASAVSDKPQIHQPVSIMFKGSRAAYDLLVDQQAEHAAVRVSLEPLASRRRIVLSAIFSLPKLLAMKGSSVDGREWVSPKGNRFVMRMCPIMDTPLYIEDAEGLTAELRSLTSLDVFVIPATMLRREIVMGLVATRKLSYTAEDGVRLGAFPTLPEYNGFMYSMRMKKRFQAVIEQLPAWSRLIPPPQNLCGNEKLPDYIHYLVDWAMTQKLDIMWPPELDVEDYYEREVIPALTEALTEWKAYPDFATYYEALKKGKAVPVPSLGAAADMAEKRRAIENVYALHTLVLGASTANYVAVEPRHVNAIMKPGVSCRVLREQGQFPIPDDVDYCGVGNGDAAQQLRVANPNVRIHSFGGQRTRANELEYTKWDLKSGYPKRSTMLYDDSYDEGSAEMEAMNQMKVKSIIQAGYLAGIVKFYLAPKVKITLGGSTSFPYDWQALLAHYQYVRLVSPGRAHSPEVYIVFAHPRVEPIGAEEMMGVVQGLVVSCFMKAILMGVANTFRSTIFRYGTPTVFTKAIRKYTQSALVDQAVGHLGFGAYGTPQIYSWDDLGVTELVAFRDEGIELLPDLVEMAQSLNLKEKELDRGLTADVARPVANISKRKSADLSGKEKEREGTRRVRIDPDIMVDIGTEHAPEPVPTRVLESPFRISK